MKLLCSLLVLLLFNSGCVSFVRELKKAPYPMIATHHSRVLGIQAAYNGYGIRVGFCSDTITLIPCATNGLTAPAFSDQLSIGQSGLDTSIKEKIDAGFKEQPPLLQKIFEKQK